MELELLGKNRINFYTNPDLEIAYGTHAAIIRFIISNANEAPIPFPLHPAAATRGIPFTGALNCDLSRRQ